MSSSDSEAEFKKKKEKKDKGKDKDKEKKDKGKDKDKDKKEKDKDKDKDKKEKDKDKGGKDKDKDKDEKKDKHKDEKKDKHKDGEKDKHGDEKKDKHKDKDKKDKKDKKDHEEEDGKKKKDKEKDKKDKLSHSSGSNVSSGPAHGGEAASYHDPSGVPSQPSQPQSGDALWFLREPGTEPTQDQHPRTEPDFPDPNPLQHVGGGQTVQNAPPSGHRIPLDPNAQFPTPDQLGRPPATDFDGSTPVFVGSAIFPDSVHPCKIIPSLHPPCRVSYRGSEAQHHGRYDLLPITQDMEWVPTSNGQIPPGRRPVEGGYEPNGGKLYHALGFIQGLYVPGKTGDHLVSRSKLSTLKRELTNTETSREAQAYRLEEWNTISKKIIASCK